jgi:WD40 repeat protein
MSRYSASRFTLLSLYLSPFFPCFLSVGTGTMSAPLKGHTGTIRSVAFQEKFGRDNSTLLASAGAGDNRPRLWDVSTGACRCSLSCVRPDIFLAMWLTAIFFCRSVALCPRCTHRCSPRPCLAEWTRCQ